MLVQVLGTECQVPDLSTCSASLNTFSLYLSTCFCSVNTVLFGISPARHCTKCGCSKRTQTKEGARKSSERSKKPKTDFRFTLSIEMESLHKAFDFGFKGCGYCLPLEGFVD